MLSLTLRQIDYATAVARHGGITRAAEALHVSQPALSVALGQVEAAVGQPLFLRRAGGWEWARVSSFRASALARG